ncbi:UDP-N-acetylmuramate dehydrogenase [Psychrobacter sp. FDAARGOS_221]|uniref:UDP-N-acetylmuramate dehydrogenase n=1 Tax=Psychrobacter sp. FDAARGOS_221 TaxID=1975705 RepID=UPI000BB575AD|nr:UDP-N-acetylmuramate dehydrogenase [Psychrobacter sp. FDAARGOS_221]PNK61545.1 UDP-N-acetylmuramate dehydrogenase [Psychrobacter sp. FDAARGOS_221]
MNNSDNTAATLNLSSDLVHINADLSHFNTMQLQSHADRLIILNDESQIVPVIQQLKALTQPLFILSGGSNVILPSRLHASVIQPALKGIRVLTEDEDNIEIEVMAGENWHELVTYSVNKGWYGLENLALIPGMVGASPVQNIGAYGVQVEDRITSLTAFHLPTEQWHQFDTADCEFSYRDSKFKREAGQWLISKVVFALHKHPTKVNANYGDVAQIAQQLAEQDKRQQITATDVMQAVIQTRKAKLPDPKQLPNCGSFFKNPIIDHQQFVQLQQHFPDIVGYPMDDQHTKVAAGWLIDKAGLKGKGIDPILTHTKQALVLVNHSGKDNPATQADVLATQGFIQQVIADKFAISLEREPICLDCYATLEIE